MSERTIMQNHTHACALPCRAVPSQAIGQIMETNFKDELFMNVF